MQPVGRTVDHPLGLQGVDRFTLPVRDLAKAGRFYTDVMGGELVQRETMEIGAREHPATRVQVCPGVDIVLVQQRFGWQPIDTPNPHWGFAIPGADVDTWKDHLNAWGVPCVVLFREDYIVELGKPTRVEMHFVDPDGNQIELVAWDYPMNDWAHRGNYDSFLLAYDYRSWPPSESA